MRRLLILVALAVTATAWGQAPEAPQEGAAAEHTSAHAAEHKESLSDTIIGHIKDSPELEFDDLSGNTHLIQLPVIRFALPGHVCPTDPEIEPSLAKGCVDISITRHVVMMWLAGLTLFLCFLFWGHRDRKNLVPRGTGANLLEMLVLFIRNEIAIPNIGKKDGPRYVPYLLTIFFFILFMNLWGLIPWMATPTGDLSVTLGLAICTFILTEIAGIRAAGVKGYLAHLTGGAPLWLSWMMIPIEILGKFTKPFALTVRLFANMIAGHIGILSLFGLIFILKTVGAAGIAIPFAVFFYFLEIFVALVQAYVFAILSAVFIGMAIAMGHHGHDEHEAHEEVAVGH
jgi:F-type H+-transporting ATPase subunit a